MEPCARFLGSQAKQRELRARLRVLPATPGPGAQADPGRSGPWVGTQPGDGHTAQQDFTWGHRLTAE